jgi:hypothetical protein
MSHVETHASSDHLGRLVEVGFIPTFTPHEFMIYFEGFLSGFQHWKSIFAKDCM